MFYRDANIRPFDKKVWLSSPTMHGPELEYVKKAYETNWMSTIGENINEVERLGLYEFERCSYDESTRRLTASVTTTLYRNRKGA